MVAIIHKNRFRNVYEPLNNLIDLLRKLISLPKLTKLKTPKILKIPLLLMSAFLLFGIGCNRSSVGNASNECGSPGQPECPEENSCLDLPVDECEAHGCELMPGHRYDAEGGCYEEEEVPVFCRMNNDIDCGWEGSPVILTDPEGDTWYISWSCFTVPDGWEVEYVPEGAPACDASCLDLPVDECEAHGCELMPGHRYDAEGGCYEEEEVPVFCRMNDDVICGWEGEPVILTDSEGDTWYISWSCFTVPDGWEVEYVSEGAPACDASCLDLPVDECEAHGCELMPGHRYDAEGGCYEEEEVPVFCRMNDDVICGWEGEPVILTDPEGDTWYISWSCFTVPDGWEVEYVPEGAESCIN